MRVAGHVWSSYVNCWTCLELDMSGAGHVWSSYASYWTGLEQLCKLLQCAGWARQPTLSSCLFSICSLADQLPNMFIG